jgi:predicted TIM-barrel fold metal-dependent hydrolase
MRAKATRRSARKPAKSANDETPIDPDRAIVDPHQHFWDFAAIAGYPSPPRRFLLPEMLATIAGSGHNITHTVFVECGAMYRADGPPALRFVGETEFVNGIAAMSASGRYGPCRLAAGIVGSADLRLGDRVRPVLEAQIAAGNGRFRGIRMETAYADVALFGRTPARSLKGLMQDSAFRKGVAALAPLGLILDLWCVHPQLPELSNLARACPDTTIVLDHIGTPLLIGPYAKKRQDVIAEWKKGIADLARHPNVVIKLGGLGMDISASVDAGERNISSRTLASKWRPYIETCIAAFGPERSMFESNFPPDRANCTYGALWNAFKRIVASYAETEQTALFSGTAKRVYRLECA